jgi:hypothetical protein
LPASRWASASARSARLLVVEEQEKREPAVVPEIEISKPGDVLRHEAIRYGLPSQSNVHVRSGYVVSYDYRYC